MVVRGSLSVSVTDPLGGNFAGVTLGDGALPTVALKAVMDVDTGIFQKICGSTRDGYKLFFHGVLRQLKAKVQGGISAAGCVGGGMLARR